MRLVVALLIVCGSVFCADKPAKNHSFKGAGTYPVARQLHYIYHLKNEKSKVLRNIRFSVYAPVRQTSYQLCQSLQSSHPTTLAVDSLGNQVLTFTFSEIAPFETLIVKVSANLKMAQQAQLISSAQGAFLEPSPYVESKDIAIAELALKLKNENALASARAAYSWVDKNIKSVKKGG